MSGKPWSTSFIIPIYFLFLYPLLKVTLSSNTDFLRNKKMNINDQIISMLEQNSAFSPFMFKKNQQLYDYRQKAKISLPLIVFNKHKEPILIMSSCIEDLDLKKAYPSLQVFINSSGNKDNTYLYKKGCWVPITSIAINNTKKKPDFFWPVSITIISLAIVIIVLLLLLK